MDGLRRVTWLVGWPARAVLIAAIRLYQRTLGGWLGGQCRFFPSCSTYSIDAIRSRGAVVGSAFAAWRVLRCNPFGAGGVDPAPLGRGYDGNLRTVVPAHGGRVSR